MKADRGKQLAHILWRVLVIALVNFMIVLMLWNSGGESGGFVKVRLPWRRSDPDPGAFTGIGL